MHWLSSFLALIDQTSELGASRISPQLSSNTSPWLLSWQLPSSIWRLGWISQNVALHWKKNMHHTPWLECWWPIFWPVASHKQILSLVLHGHLMSWHSDLFAHCDQSQQNALHKQSLHPCNLICLECNHQWIHYSKTKSPLHSHVRSVSQENSLIKDSPKEYCMRTLSNILDSLFASASLIFRKEESRRSVRISCRLDQVALKLRCGVDFTFDYKIPKCTFRKMFVLFIQRKTKKR